MNNTTIETLIGAAVVAIAAGFLYFAYTSTGYANRTGYEVQAVFANVDGISSGTDVKLHGIKVGTVSALQLDPKSYQAILTVAINEGVQIPDDSSMKVTSSGILGSSYIALQPGGSDTMLKPGGKILDTQGSVDLMGLIGRAIYGSTGSK
ncbi:MAG: outer membrane lipid asymmetry maintenance protein MlaD [Alphaproteobacteria bacterium]|nr:outer membrane lipid asymmetry maintenance protein MlaD [Alphaproteobacteria bacterium]